MRKLKRMLAALLALAMLMTAAALSEEPVAPEEMEEIAQAEEPAAEEFEVEEPTVEEPAVEEPAEEEPAEESAGESAEAEPVEELVEELPEESESAEFNASNKCPKNPYGDWHEWGWDDKAGICEYCGYECPHPKNERGTYDDDTDIVDDKPYDASCHIETFNVWRITQCEVCYKEFKKEKIKSNVTRKAPHDFHDYGSWDETSDICDGCGFDRSAGCQHPNRCNEIDRYDWENPVEVTAKAQGDDGHLLSGTMAYNEVCADCGHIFVAHPYGQYTDVLEKHDYNANSKCEYCGHKYSKKCSHEYHYDGADKHYTLYYYNKNNETYHYLHLKDAEGVCVKCGHVKYFTKAQDIKEKHVFVEGNPACVVCGYKAQPTGVTIDAPTSKTLTLGGESLSLSAKVSPEGIESAILWFSSNRAVATVSSAGVVTAVGAGSTNITAKSENGKSSKALKLTVVDPRIPTKLTLPKTLPAELGQTVDMNTKLTALEPATAELKWSSSKPEIVEIDEATGSATMLDTGSAKISVTAATASGKGVKSASMTVTVTDPKAPTKITLSSSGKIKMSTDDDPKQITATLNAEAQDSCKIEWTSSKPDVAQVDENGKITAIAKGTAKITATASKKSSAGKPVTASVTVQVTKDDFHPEDIQLNVADSLTLTTDSGPVQITAKVLPEDARSGGVTWKNSNSYAVKLDPETGTITPQAEGKATITITSKKKAANKKAITKKIEIAVEDPHAITSFALAEGKTKKLFLGEKLTLTPVFGGESERSAVTYTSKKNKGIVKIGKDDGVIEALKQGTVEITATTAKKVGAGKKAKALSAKITIQVVDPKSPSKVEIDNKDSLKSISMGTPVKLSCTVTAENGETSHDGVKWSVKDAKKALIDDEGNLYALKSGVKIVVTVTTDAKGADGKQKKDTITLQS